MIPLDEDSNELILEWLRRSRKSGQVKIALLSGAKALIGLATVEKWATERRDHYQAEQYYFRDNGFRVFLDALYNERNYPPKSTQASQDEPESTDRGEIIEGRSPLQRESVEAGLSNCLQGRISKMPM